MDTPAPLILATDLKGDWQPLVTAIGRLAKAFHRRVIPLHVVEIDTHSTLIDYFRRQVAQQLFQPLMEQAQAAAWEIAHPVVVTGPVCQRIVEFGNEQQAAMIVMGAGRINDQGTMVPGVYTEGVMQQAEQAVLAVHPQVPLQFSQILCPIDNSSSARLGLQTAVSLARQFSAPLTILTVVPQISWLEAAAEARTFTNAYEEYALQWQKDFESLIGELDLSGVSYQTQVQFGNPPDEIAQIAADKGVDLIVMGAVGRSGLSRYLIGSTLRRVWQRSPCSLWVVREQDHGLFDFS
jgi:nucleotide-binding universal stress UspA family protein